VLGEYLNALTPEVILCLAALLCLALRLIRADGLTSFVRPIALAGAVLAGIVVLAGEPGEVSLPGLTVDGFSAYCRLILSLAAALVVLAGWGLPLVGRAAEIFSMVLFSTAGAMLVASANDLVVMFFALELVSVPTYVLVAVGRDSIKAQEAGLKYFFLGALAAALTAYGFSFLYGAAGTTELLADAANRSVASVARFDLQDNPLVLIGLVLSILGISYKLAAVPMHAYAADVYQGSAAAVAGMLGFVPKLAGFAALVKMLMLVGWPLPVEVYWLLWCVAAATMTVGNTLALLQNNVKRMLAYSSIAHSGYMVLGLIVGPTTVEHVAGPLRDGIAAMLFYIAAYGVVNLGAFAVLGYLASRGSEVESLDEVAGLARVYPVVALCMAICVFALLGMPPTVGFFAKLYVFGSAVSGASLTGHSLATVVVVVVALINTAVAAGYYLRIVAAAYMAEPRAEVSAVRVRPVAVSWAVCAVVALAAGLAPGWLSGRACEASWSVAAALRRLEGPTLYRADLALPARAADRFARADWRCRGGWWPDSKCAKSALAGSWLRAAGPADNVR